MATSLISWGFALIFGGLLAREVVRQVRGIDYRAIGAAAYLGNGSVWALGLSSSAALLMATPSSIPAGLLKISGVIPLSQTIYTWQSLATVAILMTVRRAWRIFPRPEISAKTAESFGVTEGIEAGGLEPRQHARGMAGIRAGAFHRRRSRSDSHIWRRWSRPRGRWRRSI